MKAKHITEYYEIAEANVDERGVIVGYKARPRQHLIEWLEIELGHMLRMTRDVIAFMGAVYLILWLISTQARSN